MKLISTLFILCTAFSIAACQSTSKKPQIELGVLEKVENIVFEVINKNVDGSFEIEAKLDGTNIIKYGNIAQEMLRLVAQESK